jgi:hypothetical protein
VRFRRNLATPYLFEDAPLLQRQDALAQNTLLGASLSVPGDVLAPFVRENLSVEIVSVGSPITTPIFSTSFIWMHTPTQKKARLVLDPALSLTLLEKALGGAVGSIPRPLSEAEEGILCAILLSVVEKIEAPFALLEVADISFSGASLSLSIQLGDKKAWGIIELEPGIWSPRRESQLPSWVLTERKMARVIVGKAHLTQEELASLLPSDTLIPDELSCDEFGDGLGCLQVDGLSLELRLQKWQGITQGNWMEDKKTPPNASIEISVELGRVNARIQDLSQWQAGAIVPIGTRPGDPVDLVVSGKVVARGEIVRIENELGVRLHWVAP